MTNEPAIANAIHHLANEMRLLTFGGASIDPTGQGAIEGLTLTVHDTGRDIASALSDGRGVCPIISGYHRFVSMVVQRTDPVGKSNKKSRYRAGFLVWKKYLFSFVWHLLNTSKIHSVGISLANKSFCPATKIILSLAGG